ncbi:hypothetical protein TOT_040000044 [Theileria orientalis strain Shintoku]|uniref:Uncharacterized protein n=1 Tax=Theileria orientalis strain Shintoku TaxID=869250 RepID=J4C8Z8_THEOR|nr:hypothetical protein TOT_040000044 [Theileria orientalis strain Shintoku]BAM41663.1 hypothetical protein TOT_040000044 [Theileria orientalis strain Shintoku]|eukprot:XP_009691964.1 hypothetical protein TOT_040000044 [Theileria orientalis strain Shintoku]
MVTGNNTYTSVRIINTNKFLQLYTPLQPNIPVSLKILQKLFIGTFPSKITLSPTMYSSPQIFQNNEKIEK